MTKSKHYKMIGKETNMNTSKKQLTEILDGFFYDRGVGHVMFFTD